MEPQDVQSLVEQHFDRLSPELQRAARWVVRHGAALGLQSMRASARQAGVSPATMTRLARQLGLPSFEALREPFRRALARQAEDPAGYLDRARRAAAARASLVSDLNEAQAADVRSCTGLNAAGRIEAAARLMLRSRQVAFLGLRASFGIAYHLHYTFALVRGTGRLLPDPSGSVVEQLDLLGPRDLLVAVSQAPYTRETVEAVQQAVHTGVPVLALTDSALSPIARGARQVLLFSATSPSFFPSMTGAQALAEALVAAVAAQGGAAVVQHLGRRQALLRARKAYWERPLRPAVRSEHA
ncbi:MurR/RpiR family transcriptional regulator [Caldimonas manganoxidans]|uniref:MurR/RpiR family transcriptional regulator n=1 Tax=Caldimonas manganoxidans TaxID=196015 RepID=UPI000381442F|nr:MurR/RpiR family transcriptional regulator [Caldimonas manganoxidans]